MIHLYFRKIGFGRSIFSMIAATVALVAQDTASDVAIVKLAANLIDQSSPELGLDTVQATHKVIYESNISSYRYSHAINLAIFRDQLVTMWSNGIRDEDSSGQRVLLSRSGDGAHWSEPVVLANDPDGIDGPLFATSSGFHATGNHLIAYVSYPNNAKSVSDLYFIKISDFRQFVAPTKLLTNAHFIEGPRPAMGSRLLAGGMFPDRRPRLIYADLLDGVSGWQDAAIEALPELKRSFPEPGWFVRRDGTIVAFFRADRNHPWLYASLSRDRGETWSKPRQTNLPSGTSRMAVGNLPDGTSFCIWNPRQARDRNPLVIALSSDGVVFDRAWVLRGEPTSVRHPGESKLSGWQYPAAAIWRDKLWIGYSANKEDIWLSAIDLRLLRL